jgi:hypothetical protein
MQLEFEHILLSLKANNLWMRPDTTRFRPTWHSPRRSVMKMNPTLSAARSPDRDDADKVRRRRLVSGDSSAGHGPEDEQLCLSWPQTTRLEPQKNHKDYSSSPVLVASSMSTTCSWQVLVLRICFGVVVMG